jgi:putative acetyltransferase
MRGNSETNRRTPRAASALLPRRGPANIRTFRNRPTGTNVPSPDPNVRPIHGDDDAMMAAVIRRAMPEFGASGPGFALTDPEVDHLSLAYSRPGCAYFVLEDDDRVLGGAGIAPLAGGEPNTCELRKMYLLPEARGRGSGRALLDRCLAAARELAYRRCYLETLTGMDAAMRLYERAGFTRLCAPLGATGHFGCDRWFAREL